MWFRIFMLIVASCSWGITIWMATHISENADVFSRYSRTYFVLLASLFVISVATSLMLFGAAYRWAYHGRRNLILLILSIVFSLACAEVLIRMLDPIGISYYAHAKNYHLEKVADNDLYYRHQSNLERKYQGVTVKTNALGMRDDSILEKKPGVLRIAFLGDSVTFGWGARQKDIFVRRVGEILESKIHTPVRTINTGVGSYNTDNEYALLRRYSEFLIPDIVVLMYVDNDIEPTPGRRFDPWTKASFQDKSPPEVVHLVLGNSWTYRLITHLGNLGTVSSGVRLDKSSRGWKQSAAALQGISDYCASKDIPLFVFMYRMTPGQPGNDIAHELNRLSEVLDFKFDDVLPWFEGETYSALVNSRVDSHPNGQGHAILAKGIANVIFEKELSGRKSSE